MQRVGERGGKRGGGWVWPCFIPWSATVTASPSSTSNRSKLPNHILHQSPDFVLAPPKSSSGRPEAMAFRPPPRRQLTCDRCENRRFHSPSAPRPGNGEISNERTGCWGRLSRRSRLGRVHAGPSSETTHLLDSLQTLL